MKHCIAFGQQFKCFIDECQLPNKYFNIVHNVYQLQQPLSITPVANQFTVQRLVVFGSAMLVGRGVPALCPIQMIIHWI